ncbi:FtsW/RodA/SpoVE family cell cycle protein [Paenibacillus woosongensis]|uniref:Rod shape-determining protein RodA n=1 Tax=Paenibacillus woosongensis TaxID=307580 RepID=A0A7X2YYH0_9BACL|nr:FtsW/RodA/SpoVE family cell cycle protein [Paenibacillus woosongensis]MUG43496.1 rod shape-determining protein RodA [Paenibacillus woosongensis]
MIFLEKLKKLDKATVFIVLCLNAIGTVAVYGATVGTKLEGLHKNSMLLIALSMILMLLAASFDYRVIFGKLVYILYAFGIGMLAFVQFKGENINGAVRWLSIGSFQLQPSELAKIFTILLVAHMLSRKQGRKLRLIQDVMPICLVFMIPVLFIIKQPDLGTALVFVGVLLSMLWMGNIRLRYMLIFLGGVILIIGAIVWLYYADNALLSKMIKPHQMARIQTFLDPASDPDKSWHVKNAMLAIGSGSLAGDEGFFLEQGYIPYAYSDSIFVVIGEKYGFLGSAVLLLLYFCLVTRLINIVIDSKDRAGAYLVIGITAMLVFQIFVNIGMHIGLVPLTGISLPFISYGGSSLMTNMLAVGLVLNVKLHKEENIPLP